jgi:hypothetical protein
MDHSSTFTYKSLDEDISFVAWREISVYHNTKLNMLYSIMPGIDYPTHPDKWVHDNRRLLKKLE